MIYFYLPNFYEKNFQKMNLFFVEKIKNNPEYFYNNIQIGALYGSFPGVIWNGGRIEAGEALLSEVRNIINKVNSLGVSIRFTYTNCLIDSSDQLFDDYANLITLQANNGKNEILVNSDFLENHLKKYFPNFKYISSTTKCLLKQEDILSEQEKYYLTVLDYRKNKDFELLSKLNSDKIELLINPYCNTNCPSRKEHYYNISKCQIENIPHDITPNGCQYIHSFYDALNYSKGLIKVEDLYTTYINMGFHHFKIEGRCNSIVDVLESYLYYMVKPEYKDLIRVELLKQLLL